MRGPGRWLTPWVDGSPNATRRCQALLRVGPGGGIPIPHPFRSARHLNAFGPSPGSMPTSLGNARNPYVAWRVDQSHRRSPCAAAAAARRRGRHGGRPRASGDPGDRELRGAGHQVSLQYVLTDGTHLDAGAMWEDTRVGLHQMQNLDRMAVVTDDGRYRAAIKTVGVFMPGRVRVFGHQDRDAAQQWVSSPSD